MKNHSDTNASATISGFQFQINVAVYFMLKYLKEIETIRIEGEEEDVEVYLHDDSKYMIQAKAQTIDINDSNNNSVKLNTALESLAKADSDEVKYLFYASNMLNPLNTTTKEFDNYDIVVKGYDELSNKSQKKINNQIDKLEEKGISINKDKLVIIRIPFFGKIQSEKYKFIVQTAKEVFSMMSDTLANKSNTIITFIESMFNENGTASKEIKISKKEFCNWIILTEIDSLDLSGESESIGIEELDYYDAYDQYQRFIDEKTSSYENYGKVLSLYEKIRQNRTISINEFVKEKRLVLYNYFFEKEIQNENDMNEDEKFDMYVAQIISYAILKKNRIIKKIRKEANL